MSRKIHTADQVAEIIEKYNEGMSVTKLGKEYGGSHRTILNVLERNGVVRRGVGRAPWRNFTPEQQEEIIKRWKSGESQNRIAKTMGTDQTVISRFLVNNGIEPVNRSYHLRREQHPSWRGGYTLLHGYRAIKLSEDDPMWCMRITGGYILEHRLVMARHLGRPLTDLETVHHINGDRTDNSIENLQLRHGQHGAGVVPMCLDCGSHNIGHTSI